MANISSWTFAERLRRHRLAAGLTQEELAERAGLSVRGIQDLERGARMAPRAETVRMLSDGLALDDAARIALIAAANPELASSRGASIASRLPALPTAPTGLVGREREVAAACALLRHPDGGEGTRLLTVTGPGGVGKTRLALAVATELAADFPDGTVWVELAALRQAELVPAAVARALGVREESERPLAEVLIALVADRRLLLVLDNCEHLLAGMPLVSTLLASAPYLMILATSRTRLRLRGERELSLGPLTVPETVGTGAPPLAGLAGVAAVRLFVERAQAVSPGFALTEETAPSVAAICRRLEGLPLALELAAARIKVLPPAALLERLERRLPMLAGGARDLPARQQTMHDAIAWSHDLLTLAEQRLFRRLALFTGGCTLEAAEAIGGEGGKGDRGVAGHLDVLAALCDQSLVRVDERAAGEPRFVMLETIREFGLEQLAASGEEDAARRAHALVFLESMEAAQARVHGPDGPRLLDGFEADHDNLRAALAWLIKEGETELALRLAYASWRFWWMHSHLEQGRVWLERALALPDASEAAVALRPKSLVAAGYFARVQGDYALATAMGEEAQALAEQIEDAHGRSSAFHLLGLAAIDQGELDRAREHLQAALTLDREIGYSHGEAFQLSNLGDVALAQGDLTEAERAGEEALAIWSGRGDTWGVAWALVQLGKVKLAQGDEAGALALLRQSLAKSAALGDKEIAARATSEVAAFASQRGRFDLAAHLFGSVAGLREAIGAPVSPAERARHHQDLEATRAALDETTFSRYWEAGRAPSLADAVNEALAASDELGKARVRTQSVGASQGVSRRPLRRSEHQAGTQRPPSER